MKSRGQAYYPQFTGQRALVNFRHLPNSAASRYDHNILSLTFCCLKTYFTKICSQLLILDRAVEKINPHHFWLATPPIGALVADLWMMTSAWCWPCARLAPVSQSLHGLESGIAHNHIFFFFFHIHVNVNLLTALTLNRGFAQR